MQSNMSLYECQTLIKKLTKEIVLLVPNTPEFDTKLKELNDSKAFLKTHLKH